MKMRTISVVLPFLGLTLGFMSSMAQAQQPNPAANCLVVCPPNSQCWGKACLGLKSIDFTKGLTPETTSNIEPNTCLYSCNDGTCDQICRRTISKEDFEAQTK